MLKDHALNAKGFIYASLAFAVSSLLFFLHSGKVLYSAFAGLLFASLVWITFVVFKMIALSIRR